MKQHRQGDVLLIPLRVLDAGEAEVLAAMARKSDSLIVALGEGTGHAHVLEAPVWTKPAVAGTNSIGTPEFTNGGKAEIAVLWPGTLKHVSIVGEEIDHRHADQEIEPGWYEVRTQKAEYKPAPRARSLDYD